MAQQLALFDLPVVTPPAPAPTPSQKTDRPKIKAARQISFGLAVTDPDAHRQAQKRKARTCLRCSEYFLSAHAGNRLCPSCLSSADFQAATEYSIAF